MDESELPFVDAHSIVLAAPTELAWSALESYVNKSLDRIELAPIAWILGTKPRAGFAVEERMPPTRLALAGRHRFSRYRLVFTLTGTAGGTTQLKATTYALFPGLHGRLYRALVIGTRGHVLGVHHMLRSVERTSRRLRARSDADDEDAGSVPS